MKKYQFRESKLKAPSTRKKKVLAQKISKGRSQAGVATEKYRFYDASKT